ncbi:MAG: CxxxxCH/CxxCH domain c-type cytochrome [Myxococcales bacterium]
MHKIEGVLAAALATAACSDARQQQGDPAHPVSWVQDIAPLYASQCNSCHSGPGAQAGYRTTSYLEALGPTSAPVAVPGDSSSRLLNVIDPAKADTVHQPVSSAFNQSRAWVVDGRVSYSSTSIHEGGILNPNDSEFHMNLVRAQNWNFSLCQGCHGADLTGAQTGVSCQTCHVLQVAADGSTSCSSCHGSAQTPAPPRDVSGDTDPSTAGVGAHQAHVVGKTFISAPVPCGTCHQVPAQVGSAGHLDNLLPAEVNLSGPAGADSATPRFDPNTLSCSGVYCHGNGADLANDTKFQLRTPVWTGGTSQAFCGSCHGLPPSPGHPSATFPNCSGCHPRTVNAQGGIITSTDANGARTSFHINGVVDVGR